VQQGGEGQLLADSVSHHVTMLKLRFAYERNDFE